MSCGTIAVEVVAAKNRGIRGRAEQRELRDPHSGNRLRTTLRHRARSAMSRFATAE
jgi:hypothetical protein